MSSEDTPSFVVSGTALSAPQTLAGNDSAEVSYLFGENLDITPDVIPDVMSVGGGEVAARLEGKVFRVMGDQLFLVDPGSPPPSAL